jgi:hypothetical protein
MGAFHGVSLFSGVFEDRVMRMLGPKREELTGG